MKSHTAILLAGTFVAVSSSDALPAQRTQFVPAGQNFERQLGEIAWYAGFDGMSASRFLALYSNAAVGIRNGALLREIAFRPSRRMTSATTRTVRVALGYPLPGVTPSRMYNDYAKVTGGLNRLQQVANTRISLPAFNSVGGGTAFSIRIPIAPFVYSAQRGGLVVSVESNAETSTSSYGVDAFARASDASGVESQYLMSSCKRATSGFPASLLVQDLKTWVPGSSGTLYFYRFRAAQALFMLGTRRDRLFPIDLTAAGMPGCRLWTAPEVIVPTRLRLAGRRGFGGYQSIDLPNRSELTGLKLRAQALVIDAQANRAGLVLSDGLDITVGTPSKRAFLARAIYEIVVNQGLFLSSQESAPILRLSYF